LVAVVLEPQPAAVDRAVGIGHVDQVVATRTLDPNLKTRLPEAGLDQPEAQPGLGGGGRSTIGVAEDVLALVVAGSALVRG
jgi:hypothetical protein